jgi:tRNA isopentenyl-2-thiomethyl-A-37 hydroxylase MiaE
MTEVTVINATTEQPEISLEEKSLVELVERIEDLQTVALKLLALRREGLFHFLSKKTRNEMTRSMLDHSDSVLEASKAAFKNLKRDKRVRVPDELCDQLILENRLGAIVVGRLSNVEPVKDEDDDAPGGDQQAA